MYKYFCDACKEEQSGNRDLNEIFFRVHIVDIYEEDKFSSYVDDKGTAVSRKENSIKVCHKCYNRIMGNAYDTYLSIKGDK